MEVTVRNYEDEVTKLAEKYCSATGISLGTLGNKVVKEFEFFTRIKDGKGDRRINTVRRAVIWLEENMPSPVPKRNGKHNSNVSEKTA